MTLPKLRINPVVEFSNNRMESNSFFIYLCFAPVQRSMHLERSVSLRSIMFVDSVYSI